MWETMGVSATHWAWRMTRDNSREDLEVLEDDGELLRSLDRERGRVSASYDSNLSELCEKHVPLFLQED